MHQPVRISDIGLYLRCPRLVYFDSLGSLPRRDNPEHLLLHSVMIELSSEGDLHEQLREILARLERELPLVYEIEPDDLRPACRELEGRIEEIACSLSQHVHQLFPSDVEVDLRSESLGLSGRLDRLIMDGGVPVPSLIRTGTAPEVGVWKRDRLMLAGYALMLQEMHRTRIGRGLVEYPREGVVRDIQIHSVDRSRVLRIRDRVRQIKEGRLPDRSEDGRCQSCESRERCETRVSLASRFF
jgi:CRISPR-associated exonuclease Cas4